MRNAVSVIWNALRNAYFKCRYRDRHSRVAVDELPDALQKRCLYLIGGTTPWAAAMLCPCGCGAVIQLSLLNNESPSWTVTFDRAGLPTLSPSVWRTQGCRSHFFLRCGSIVWCRERKSDLRETTAGPARPRV